MWVRIPFMTCVCLSKILYYHCFSSPRGIKWIPARVEVDILFEKAFIAPRQLRLYTVLPRELRNITGMLLANDEGTYVKCTDPVNVKSLYKSSLVIYNSIQKGYSQFGT